jgi:hypothetical protein
VTYGWLSVYSNVRAFRLLNWPASLDILPTEQCTIILKASIRGTGAAANLINSTWTVDRPGPIGYSSLPRLLATVWPPRERGIAATSRKGDVQTAPFGRMTLKVSFFWRWHSGNVTVGTICPEGVSLPLEGVIKPSFFYHISTCNLSFWTATVTVQLGGAELV